jgi:hypothetical protein
LLDLLNEGTVFLSTRLNLPNLKQVHNYDYSQDLLNEGTVLLPQPEEGAQLG